MSRNAGNYENDGFGEISLNSPNRKISQNYANDFNRCHPAMIARTLFRFRVTSAFTVFSSFRVVQVCSDFYLVHVNESMTNQINCTSVKGQNFAWIFLGSICYG